MNAICVFILDTIERDAKEDEISVRSLIAHHIWKPPTISQLEDKFLIKNELHWTFYSILWGLKPTAHVDLPVVSLCR